MEKPKKVYIRLPQVEESVYTALKAIQSDEGWRSVSYTIQRLIAAYKQT